MTLPRFRLFPAAVLAVVMGATVAQTAPEVGPAPRVVIPLPGYKTVAEAVKANPKEFKVAATPKAAGFLGIVIGEKAGKPVVEVIAPESPAETAGVKEGDVLVQIDSQAVASAAEARDVLRGKSSGDELKLTVSRGGSPVKLAATLKPTTSPKTLSTTRAVLGVTLGGVGPNGGVKLSEITTGGPADKAGLKANDAILKIDGVTISGETGFRDYVGNKSPGDPLELIVERGEMKIEKRAVLEAEESRPMGKGGGFGGGWDDRIRGAWTKPTYKLAILGVEYPDLKHNAKIKDSDWEESMFSLGTYTGKSATGETVHGSMNDYYKEISYEKLKIEGKFLGWVEASKKRMDYSTGSGTNTKEKTGLLTEAFDLYTKKAGKDSLKDYDGIFFIYAGTRATQVRGGLYWPHRANVGYGGKNWPYFIVEEGGSRMNDISVFCHEFGHMLGLPDLYARPEQPGSEGVWQWCAMSNQIGNGHPQHFSVWSKEQLKWVQPTVIDPRVQQKLVLKPIEDDPTQCFKVMVRPDGSEFFLLENRKRTGWDKNLPGEGLLIWRVVNNKPLVEESHGIEGARGPSAFPGMVPFPSASNNSFTPFTVPSSKSQLGGGLPVWITNIRRLPDGRITFQIGYEYQ